jgi:hypothetical protein
MRAHKDAEDPGGLPDVSRPAIHSIPDKPRPAAASSRPRQFCNVSRSHYRGRSPLTPNHNQLLDV